jgi:hypothetical protein
MNSLWDILPYEIIVMIFIFDGTKKKNIKTILSEIKSSGSYSRIENIKKIWLYDDETWTKQKKNYPIDSYHNKYMDFQYYLEVYINDYETINSGLKLCKCCQRHNTCLYTDRAPIEALSYKKKDCCQCSCRHYYRFMVSIPVRESN